MAEDSDLERTEPASGRRLEKAREEGQVPHSRELGTFLGLLVAAIAFGVLGSWFAQRLAGLMRQGLTIDSVIAHEPQLALVRFAEISFQAFLIFVPLLAAFITAAVLGPILLGSLIFAPKTLLPDLSRLNPLSGIKRLISLNGLVEMLKAIAKTLLLGGVAIWVIWGERNDIFALFSQAPEVALSSAGNLLSFSFIVLVSAMSLIVAADVPFQIWQYHDKLKMTREELKQESKESEGNPQTKGRIRSLQREAARKRMMTAIPTADVIVTNPTHFSVALAYKNGMGAPKVVAKGRGEIALKIREIGAEHRVPILEAPPLARALYRYADFDQEIPAGLYAAVAEVLAYIYQLNHWRQLGGHHPTPPRDLPIPPALMPELHHV
ncbi:MAG: flagellar biosynthesis protein FlhB [Pseudomonadota bacterium]